MNLTKARVVAREQSEKFVCAKHVNASIVKVEGRYEIDQTSYYVSDWHDGCTVETYVGGEQR
jgi:hypothetical protein